MTEFKPSRALVRAVLALVGLLSTGCRMGLPPEPPGADATDAKAAIPAYQTPPDPFTRSAFAGQTLKSGAGHEGHHRPASPEEAQP